MYSWLVLSMVVDGGMVVVGVGIAREMGLDSDPKVVGLVSVSCGID